MMVKDILQRQAEFSRPVAAGRVGDSEIVEEIAASEAERSALAERFGWLSMRRLAATVRLRRLGRDLIRVSGRYDAELERPCVVTLEPVPAHLEGGFSLLYGEAVTATAASAEDDPPEPIVAGRIDLGEAVVQQLAVALDPYPRAPGAALPEAVAAPPPAGEAEEPRGGPFAVLGKLRQAGRSGRR